MHHIICGHVHNMYIYIYTVQIYRAYNGFYFLHNDNLWLSTVYVCRATFPFLCHRHLYLGDYCHRFHWWFHHTHTHSSKILLLAFVQTHNLFATRQLWCATNIPTGSRLFVSDVNLAVLVELRESAPHHCPSPVVFRRWVAGWSYHAKCFCDISQQLVLPAHEHCLFGGEHRDALHEPLDVVSSRGGVDGNSRSVGERRQCLHGAVTRLIRVCKKVRGCSGKLPCGVGEEFGEAIRALHATRAEIITTILLTVTDKFVERRLTQRRPALSRMIMITSF